MATEGKRICIAGHRWHGDKAGGVEMQTRYLGAILADRGWRVTFLCPDLSGRGGRERIDDRTEIRWYPHFSFSWQAPVRFLEEALAGIGPDVIYQRGRGQLTGNPAALRYAGRRNVPYVFALSSDIDLEGRYHSEALWNSPIPLWKKLLLTAHARGLDRSMSRVLADADYLVALHEGQERKIREVLGRTPCRLPSVHRRVEGEVSKARKKTVLWISNYRPLKRGELFVDLARECRGLDCRFVMVTGRARESYLQGVRARAGGLENLELLGEISFEEADDLIGRASLLVNTSEYEGFPNTFIQGWLRETPTVSLTVDPGGVIGRERLGRCSGSFEKMVGDVSWYVTHEGERAETGKHARAWAEKNHSIESRAADIERFFSGAAERRLARS